MNKRQLRFCSSLSKEETRRFRRWLSKAVHSRRRVAPEVLEEHRWIARLAGPWHEGSALYERLLRSLPSSADKLHVAARDPNGRWETYSLPLHAKKLQATMAYGEFGNIVVTTPDRSVLLLRDYPEFNLLAGSPDFVRKVTGLSLETQWKRYEHFANEGEGSERQRRELLELMRYYAPFNGLEDYGVSEIAPDRLWVEALDPLPALKVDECPTLQDFGLRNLLRDDWTVGVIPMTISPGSYTSWEWSFTAERIAGAARELGVESGKMIPFGSHRPWPFRLPMSRDGWMGFERRCTENDYLLRPEGGEFVAVGRQERVLLLAGPKPFIDAAFDGISIDERIRVFEKIARKTHEQRQQCHWILYSGMWGTEGFFEETRDEWEEILIEQLE